MNPEGAVAADETLNREPAGNLINILRFATRKLRLSKSWRSPSAQHGSILKPYQTIKRITTYGMGFDL
jgi:hypothetical protein